MTTQPEHPDNPTVPELVVTHHSATDTPAKAELLDVHEDANADILGDPFNSSAHWRERFEDYIRGPEFDLEPDASTEA